MKFSNIVIKNLKHNLSKFASYLFVNIFVIAMLFTYGSIMFNPNINEDPILSSAMDFVYIGVVAILLFCIIFVTYTGICLIKNRGKELSIYLVLGMSKRNLATMIVIENAAIMLMSVIFGIGFGTLFSKLFYLVLERVLDTSNLFYLDIYTYLLGIGFFIIIFISNIVYSIAFIYRTEIKNISIADKTKGMKVPSVRKGIIGVSLFSISSILLYLIFTNNSLVDNLNDYTTEVILASVAVQFSSLYILIGSGLNFVVSIVSRNKKFYNRNIIFLSNIKFSFMTYKSSLFMLTLMMGMSVCFMGIQISFKEGGTEIMNTVLPYDFMVENNEKNNNIEKVDIENIVNSTDAQLADYKSFEYASSQIYREKTDYFYYYGVTTMMISESEFNNTFNQNIDLAPDELLMISNGNLDYGNTVTDYDTYLTAEPQKQGMETINQVRSENLSLSQFKDYTNKRDTKVFEYAANKTKKQYYNFINSYGEMDFAIVEASVVDDSVYNQITNPDITKVQEFNVTGESQEQICTNLRTAFSEQNINENENLTSNKPICKLENVEQANKGMAMFSFTMTFISVLFLIASSVVLYYKLVSDTDYEREQVKLFTKIGVDRGTTERYLKNHTAFIFFTPLILGGALGLLYTYVFFYNLPAPIVSKLIQTIIIMFSGFIVYDVIFYLIIKRVVLKKSIN